MASTSKPPRLEVFLIVLLDVMGLGLIIPGQPFLAKNFGATPGTITLIGTTYALMQFLLSPVWGGLSDRFGRRPILLTTLAMTAIGHLAFASANSLALLFLARALAGAGAANISTAQAVLSDTHAPAERGRAMAIIGAAFGLGFVFGPALGGILFKIDHRAPALFAAALAALNILFVFTRVPETSPFTGDAKSSRGKLFEFLRLDRDLQRLVFTTFLTITAFALMEQTIGLYIERTWVTATERAGMNEAASLTSLFLVVVGITAVGAQGYLVRKWLVRTPEATLCRLGLLVIGVSLSIIPVLASLGSFSLFLLAAVLLALGSSMFNPSMAGLVSLTCPPDKQGIGLALNQSGQALGRIIGPTLAGALFAVGAPAPFLTGALLTCVAFVMALPIRARR